MCRRTDVTYSLERQANRPSQPLSPGASELPTLLMSSGAGAGFEPLTNESVLNLLGALAERVKHLETRIDGLEPRKRPALDIDVTRSSA